MVGGAEYALLYGGCCLFVTFSIGVAGVLLWIGRRGERLKRVRGPKSDS